VLSRLLDNGWLHLWRFADGGGFERRARAGWHAVAA
jgi:hypothetical protein